MTLKGITLAVALAAALLAARQRTAVPRPAVLVEPEGPPLIAADGGAQSVQAAELWLSPSQLAVLWSTDGLELLAGTYWRFLPRISLGAIRVLGAATEERVIVLGGRPLVLLYFAAPEYELDGERGSVRWRIRGGLLLAPGGGTRRGSLQIALRRLGPPQANGAVVHVEVAVSDFAPAVARVFGLRVYEATQSRIHVLVTHGFLRSLARLDLAPSPATGAPAGGGCSI